MFPFLEMAAVDEAIRRHSRKQNMNDRFLLQQAMKTGRLLHRSSRYEPRSESPTLRKMSTRLPFCTDLMK